MQFAGCLLLCFIFFALCLLPVAFVDLMNDALDKLHLEPRTAAATVLAIFVGSFVNLPVHRIRRDSPQPVQPFAMYGLDAMFPRWQQMRQDTVIAVNVGGCVIPLLLAVWEISHLIDEGRYVLFALVCACAGSIGVSYRMARPVPGIGIMTPAFAAPLTSILFAWLLLGRMDYDQLRAPVAFVAGVLGPLIGADLLHIRDVQRVPVGMLSIGGAGTFDGIVLSGILAAYFA